MMMVLLMVLMYIVIASLVLLLFRIVIVVTTIQKNRQHAIQQSSSISQQQQRQHSTSSSSSKHPTTSHRWIPPTIKDTPSLRTLIILGSGGHTSELLYMTQYLNHPTTNTNNNNKVMKFNPIMYCKASTDTTSQDRLRNYQMSDHNSNNHNDSNNNNHTDPSQNNANTTRSMKKKKETMTEIYNIPRSREVGQSYISSIYTTFIAILYSMKLVYTLRPNVILCNGPGTCIPICWITFVYRIFNILPNHQTYIIFMESFCRVQTLSLSGKLLYTPPILLPILPAADLFIVHWKELHDQYPNSILTNTYI